MKKIGRYVIETELGRGGFGKVYRAYDPVVGRPVAIKILTAQDDDDQSVRFRNEAAASGRLVHKNIVTIYDYGQEGSHPYIVMELVEGRDLSQILKDEPQQLDLGKKLDIIYQVTEGLQAAHRIGIVHRDVKPANIMVLPSGLVKILDFGIARWTGSAGTRLTRPGYLIGSIHYMSPEQFQGLEVDERSDIFSLGVVAYQLLTGKHPFWAETQAAVIYNVTQVDPPRLSEHVADLPPELDSAILSALLKDRELRPASVEDLRLDLQPVLLELKRREAEGMLSEAERLLDGDDPDAALTILRKVLRLDPAHAGARKLRRQAETQVSETRRAARTRKLVEEGNRLLEGRDFEGAGHKFREALGLEANNEELKKLVEECRARAAGARHARRVFDRAKGLLDKGDAAAADAALEEALASDPELTNAPKLREHVRAALEEEKRKRRLEDAFQQAQAHVAGERFDQARRAIRVLRDQDYDAKRLETLEADLQRKVELQSEIELARERIAGESFESAVRRLESLRRANPERVELADLLAEAQSRLAAQRRRQAIEELRTSLDIQIREGQFADALAGIRRVRREHGEGRDLDGLEDEVQHERASRERETALERARNEAGEAAAEGRFDDALKALEDIQRSVGPDTRVERLHAEIEQRREQRLREEAIQELAERSRARIESEQFAEAIAELERECLQLGNARQLTELLEQARVGLDRQRRARQAERAVERARKLADEQNFAEAIKLLDRTRREIADTAGLRDALEQIRTAETAHVREQAIRKGLAEGGAALDRMHFERAAAIVDETIAVTGQDPRLAELRDEIDRATEHARRETAIQAALEEARRLDATGLVEQAVDRLHSESDLVADPRISEALSKARQKLERQRRATLLTETAAEADRLLAGGDAEAALNLVESRNELAGEAEIEARREKAQAEVNAARRRQNIETALGEAAKLEGEGRYDLALAALDKALTSHPDAEPLLSRRAAIEAARARNERETALEVALGKAMDLERNGRFEDALGVLDDCLARYPGETSLVEARSRLEVARERAQLIENARALIARADHAEAVELLEPAVARSPDSEDLAAALADAKRFLAERRRDELIADIVQRADNLAGEKRFEEAIRTIDGGLEKEPGILALQEARDRIGRQRQAHDRDELVQTVLRKVERSTSRKGIEDALASLEAALELAPRDARLIDAKTRVSLELRDCQREEAVKDAVALGRRLLDADQLDEAVRLLQDTNEQFPGAAELEHLLALCRNRKKARDGERTIQKVLSETARLAESLRYEEALGRIRSATSEYPDDDRLTQRERELSTAKEGIERQQRIDQAVESAKRQAAEGAFDASLATLELALAHDPDDNALRKLRAEVQEKRGAAALRQGREELDEIERRVAAQNLSPRSLRKLAKETEAVAARLPKEAQLQERCRQTQFKIAAALGRASDHAKLPVGKIAAGIGVAAAIGAGLFLLRPGGGPDNVELALEIVPAGATVEIGEQICVMPGCALSVLPGEHSLRVTKPGYAPATRAISIPQDQSEPVRVEAALDPLPSIVELVTDLESGRVFLDDRPPASLENGKWSLLDLEPGEHRLRVESGRTRAEVAFRTQAGAPPVVPGGASAEDASVLGVSRLGGEGRAFATGDGTPAQLDGNPIGSVGPEGLPLGELTADADHTFTMGQGDDERRVIFDVLEAPALSLYLFSDRSVGSVVVRTGQPGARVNIGDRTFETSRDGSVRALLDIGSYNVRVTKDGFRSPPAKSIDVRKGIEQSVEIELSPVNPVLAVRGGEPGAELLIDGGRKAVLDASGDASVAVDAGSHVIELRKEGFRPQRLNRSLQPGQSLVLEGADVQLAKLPPPPQPGPSIAERQEREYREALERKDREKLIAIRNDSNHPHSRDAAEALREMERPPEQPRGDDFRVAKANGDLAKLQAIAADPTHPSARDAAELVKELGEKKEVDDAIASGDVARLRNVIAKYPNGVNAPRAELKLNELLRQDREALLALLLRYSDSFKNQDIEGIQAAWPTLPADTLESLRQTFKDKRNSVQLVFQPVEDPKIMGSNQATWQCKRAAVGASGRRAVGAREVLVEVDFARQQGRWVIRGMRELH